MSIDGSALVFNQADPRTVDMLVCWPALAGVVLEAVGEVGDGF